MIHVRIEPTQLALNQIASLSIILTNSADTVCTHVGFRLRLPPQIVLLEGNDTIDLPRIDPFQGVTKTMRVRPKQIGTWSVSSSSFSYRDSRGESQHPPPLHQEVKVVPVTLAPAISEPKVHVNLFTETLPFNEWDQLEGEIANVGNSTLYGVSYRVMGPVSKDTYTARDSVDVLHPGETKRFQVLVKAEASGNKVPFRVEIAYSDETGLRRTYNQLTPIRVTEHCRVDNSQSLGLVHYKHNAATEMNSMSVPKIFISYSHVDEKHMLRLVSMLKPLEKQGIFHIWHDRAITAGDEWYQEIQNAINTCDLALLLVSIDFLNSRFIQEDELPRLLQLRKERGLRVVPIIVRHCTWTSIPFLKDLQALPKDGRPVVSFRGSGQPDRIWAEIAKSVEELAKKLILDK